MKKRSFLRTGTVLLLVLAMLASLCGCPSPDNGDGTSSTTTPQGGENTTPTDTPVVNGAAIAGTGDRIPADAAVLSPISYDEAAVTEKSAADVRKLFRGNGPDAGLVIRISGDGVYGFEASNRSYDANGMILIAPGGVTVEGSEGLTIRNLTVIGSLSVTGSQGVRFENVCVKADGTALTVDSASADILLADCRIEGGTAASLGAENVAFLGSYIGYKSAGISHTAGVGLYLADCRIVGESGAALKTAADNTEIRHSTISTDKASAAIEIGEARNVLVGASVIRDAEKSIVLTGTDNASLTLNSAVSISAANGKHIYVIDNALGGKLYLSDNDYLIADGNTFPSGDLRAATVASGNQNTNGDNLMDVDARLAVGADPNLVPHVDKDQFLYETRRDTVKDPAASAESSVVDYIKANAAKSPFVILMPGAYKTTEIRMTAAEKNTTVYGYGALLERPLGVKEGVTPDYTSNGRLVTVVGTENVVFKGETFGFERDSAGQAYILEKMSGNRVRLHAAAGFYEDFLSSNLTLFNESGINLYRGGEMYPIFEPYDMTFVSREADGTLIFKCKNDAHYNMMRVGDILTCRNKVGAGAHISSETSSGTVYEDVTVFGNSGGPCFYEGYVTGAVTYHRVADTMPAAEIIDEETYNYYKNLEKQYKGLKTDVRFDGRDYRGDISRYSSIDATHVVGSRVGSQIISCLFENMCDDATNQHSYPSRLSMIYENADGKTATVVFKPMLGDVSYSGGNRKPSSMTREFSVGDRIYIYNNDGELVCDANVLSAQAKHGEISFTSPTPDKNGDTSFTITTYSVTVPKEAVVWDALASYTLDKKDSTVSTWAENSNSPLNRISVDNRSYYADGFKIDNLVTRNVRSRALLIKSSDGIIKNCTLEHFAGDGVSVSYEHTWCESGVVENLVIENNVFDHVGYNNDAAAIRIFSMGYPDFSKDSVFANFTIRGNVIKNRASTYAVEITGAMNVLLENNDFGSYWNMMDGAKPKMTIILDSVRDITLSGNTYPDKTMSVVNSFHFTNVKGLTGSDVKDGALMPEFQ